MRRFLKLEVENQDLKAKLKAANKFGNGTSATRTRRKRRLKAQQTTEQTAREELLESRDGSLMCVNTEIPSQLEKVQVTASHALAKQVEDITEKYGAINKLLDERPAPVLVV